MKVTEENINDLNISVREIILLRALFEDLDTINKVGNTELYIDWQDWHNKYSPERIDPCPDYYGYYTIRSKSDPSEILGVEMTIDDLDMSLCLLYNYVVDLKIKFYE